MEDANGQAPSLHDPMDDSSIATTDKLSNSVAKPSIDAAPVPTDDVQVLQKENASGVAYENNVQDNETSVDMHKEVVSKSSIVSDAKVPTDAHRGDDKQAKEERRTAITEDYNSSLVDSLPMESTDLNLPDVDFDVAADLDSTHHNEQQSDQDDTVGMERIADVDATQMQWFGDADALLSENEPALDASEFYSQADDTILPLKRPFDTSAPKPSSSSDSESNSDTSSSVPSTPRVSKKAKRVEREWDAVSDLDKYIEHMTSLPSDFADFDELLNEECPVFEGFYGIAQYRAKLSGVWAFNHEDLRQGGSRVSKFEYSSSHLPHLKPFRKAAAKKPTLVIPYSGSYSGFFNFRQFNGKVLKIRETQLQLTFAKVGVDSDEVVSHVTLLGRGRNQFGRFLVKGSLALGDGQVLLRRRYLN